MMSLWDALRMNMMISYQELVRTFLKDDGGADTKGAVDVQEREGSIETRLSPSPLTP